ncbi:MAG TPA: hypothetical protein VMZ25_00265 [Terriglobales bacterium]|nr:hypothetical protein [Terriglobales bacterium]
MIPRLLKQLLTFVLFLLLATAVFAQEPKSSAAAPSAGKKITPAERDELFKSVDEILQWVSKDTGLPIRSKIKRKLSTRDEVQKYVEERMAEDEDQKRLERSELVLKKFGLLPREFKLRPFMIALLKDQVAGFYDSRTKTVHLLDWIDSGSQKPVMAHELTHALQDQSVDLDQWVKDARERAKKAPDRETAETELDEMISARAALLEGQGMAVLLDYILEPQGRSLKDSPQLAEALKASMTSTQGSEVLESAPLLLRESLVFPYRDGLGFVQALLDDGGLRAAYYGALQHPPRNTRDILSPESYLQKQILPELKVPDFEKAVGKSYAKYDVGSIGQFDIVLFGKQFSSNVDARELSSAWRGGFYYGALKSTAAKKAANITDDLGVLYFSRWSSPDTAKRFAKLYARSFKIKYSSATQDNGKWNSEEGPMSVEVLGDSLLIMEGFDTETAARLRSAVMNGQPSSETAKVAGNLSLKTVSPIFALRLMLHE